MAYLDAGSVLTTIQELSDHYSSAVSSQSTVDNRKIVFKTSQVQPHQQPDLQRRRSRVCRRRQRRVVSSFRRRRHRRQLDGRTRSEDRVPEGRQRRDGRPRRCRNGILRRALAWPGSNPRLLVHLPQNRRPLSEQQFSCIYLLWQFGLCFSNVQCGSIGCKHNIRG